jgi:hypothetical protein
MMADHDFDVRLQQIQEGYAARRDGAEAYRDQELARLFEKCGWPQEKIAKRMGKKQQWVSYRLIFARFLQFTTDRCKTPFATENLTEWRFRTCWGKTDRKASERERFAAVAVALAAPVLPSPRYMNLVKKPGIRPAIVGLLKDRQRRSVADMAVALDGQFPGITTKQVTHAVGDLQKRPPKGFAVEARHVGQSHKYRLTQRTGAGAPPVSPDEAGMTISEVIPLIQEAQAELKKSTAALSISFLMERLAKAERALSRLLVPAEVV